MAKIDGIAAGGFRGRLGNMVGYSWKGVWCVRKRPERVRNPRSEAQQRHRGLFAAEVRLAGRMSWALNVGLAAVSDEMRMTPQNVFVKANQGAFSAVEGSASELAVDWESLIISAGPVAPVALATPTVSAEGVLAVEFEKNPLHLRADNFDQVRIYVYCPSQSIGYLSAPVYRKDRKVSMVLPDGMVGQGMHLYAFVTDNAGRASETVYGGQPVWDSQLENTAIPELPEQPVSTEISDNLEQLETPETPAEAPATNEPAHSNQLSLFDTPE